jgi:hypothetical protein
MKFSVFMKLLAESVPAHGCHLYSQPPTKRAIRRFFNFRGRYRFENRSRGAGNLVLVVAGYREPLWPIVFPRLARFVPPGYDVCVVCPGSHHPGLAQICEKEGWSFLSTRANRLALAQNLALRAHPAARWIFKFDEDIVIAAGYFEAMTEAWALIERENRYRPGILAPLLNVNGYSSRIFLERRGRLADFIARFGEARQNCMDTCVWKDPAAAAWLWEASRPFDNVAREIAAPGPAYSACPHRLSIGAFLMPRRFWEEMQGFSVAPQGLLGIEEIDLAAHAMATSQVIAVAHHILAGHAGFGSQTEQMIPLLQDRPDLRLPAD